MTVWTLQYFGQGTTGGTAAVGAAQSLAAWGIGNAKLNRQSHQADVLTFTVLSAKVDDTELFGYLSIIGIYRNGVQWFKGYVTKIPRQGSPSAESMQYEVSGPWLALKSVVFQQQWYSFGSVQTVPLTSQQAVTLIPTTRSRIIFGSSDQNTKMDLGQVLTAALNWCISCYVNNGQPAPFAVGQITPSLTIPYSEVTDRSCDELVQLCLRWLPDAVTWFDYTQATPLLNIAQRAGLGSLTLTVGSAPLSAIPQLTPRYDLIPPVVVVKYEQQSTIDGITYDALIIDQYPTTVSDTVPRALIQTIDLAGENATFQKQSITTLPRPIDYASNADSPTNAESYIKIKHLALKDIPLTDLRACVLVTTIDPKSPDQSTQPSAVPEELVKGALAAWMPGISQLLLKTFTVQYLGNDAQYVKLFPDLTFTYPNGGPTVAGKFLTFVVPVTATNLSTGTFQQCTSITFAEPMPTGLAQGQYDALSQLHYEGEVTLVENECGDWLLGQGAANWFGANLNISDSAQSAWASMAARIEKVSEDFDRGTTQISIGPPKILGLEDWHALLKAQRGRQQTWRLQQKQDAMVGEGKSVAGSDHAPQSGIVSKSGNSVNVGTWGFKANDTSSGAQGAVTINGTGNPSTADAACPGTLLSGNGSITDSNANVRMTVSGSGVIWLKLTLDSNQYLTAVQSGTSGMLPPSDTSMPPSYLYVQIGTYNVTIVSGVANANVTNATNYGYTGFQYCGGQAFLY